MNKLENINKKIDELKKEIANLEIQKNNINTYTCIFIVRPKTTLKALQVIKDTIKNIVELENNFEDLGLKKLAYEISKEKEGYYIQFDFTGFGEDVQKLEKYYIENDNIIKFLTMRKPDED